MSSYGNTLGKMLPSPDTTASLHLSKMITNHPWIKAGDIDCDNPTIAVTSDPDILINRISCLLERLLSKVIRHRIRMRDSKKTSSSSTSSSEVSGVPFSEPNESDSIKRKEIPSNYVTQAAIPTGRKNVLKHLEPSVRSQLRMYVARIASMYRDVHFHSLEHAYHVTISANQLINMILTADVGNRENAGWHPSPNSNMTRKKLKAIKHFSSYGISSDPISHFTVVFAALVHDVDHRGITNHQLVKEGHPLAIRFNDQSVAEQNSVAEAYEILTEPEFFDLKCAICETPEESKYFRKLLISLIMATDIASPDRVQLGKSKWKEAFSNAKVVGDAIDMRVEQMTRNDTENNKVVGEVLGGTTTVEGGRVTKQERRWSNCSTSTTTSAVTGRRDSLSSAVSGRRGSLSSITGRRDSLCSTTSEMPLRSFEDHDNSSSSDQLSQENHNKENDQQERRHSACSSSRQELRLGIKQTLTLHGSTIEFYPHDEHDKLKASAVLDQIIQAADVAHTMQSFEVFKKWNERLYRELFVAFQLGRGQNASPNWFAGQISFFDGYIIPLATRLKQCCVFGDLGETFLNCAMENKRRWLLEGKDFSEMIKRIVLEDWKKNYQQEEGKMIDVEFVVRRSMKEEASAT